MRITRIKEHKTVAKYMRSRQLLDQYLQAKKSIFNGNLRSVDFRKRRPYKSKKYYFKISKKYRALGFFEEDVFKVFEISDHQE